MNLDVPNVLTEQIRQVTQAEQQIIHRNLKQLDLNLIQARALNFIAQHPAAIQKELSQYLGKPNATTTNILKVLEARQLIVRRVQAGNERQKQLYLLPDGQELMQAINHLFMTLEAQVAAPLSAAEQQTLLTLLQRVNQYLKQK